MNNKELMNQILSELKNLKNLDYSKSEDEVLNNKNLILDKIRKLLSQIDSLKIEEEKQITQAINNIRISNLEKSILESIENITSVLKVYIEISKEEIKEEKEDKNNKLEKLSEDLESLSNANYTTKITAKRGRLIREIQREISKLKSSGKEDEKTIEALEQLETRLSTEIENHKNQLNDRYSKEFSEKEATVPAILTVLPMGVALQATKVETCIREMVAAKTNKQRIFAAVNVAKALGMTVATPVIFTVKFIIKHWYLILLLLSLIKLPHFNFGNKPKPELEPELEKEPVYETVTENAREPVTSTVTENVTDTVTDPVIEPKPGPVVDPNPGPVVNPKPGPVVNPNPGPVVGPVPGPVVIEQPEQGLITAENSGEAAKVMGEFIDGLENRYGFLVGELHEDITVVHNAEEFAKAFEELTGRSLDPSKALDTYKMGSSPSIRPIDKTIVWPEMDSVINELPMRYFETSADLITHIQSGQDEYLTDFFTSFSENYGKSLFENFDISGMAKGTIENIANTLGVSFEVAATIAILYEAAQYGLAPITGGLSMALPG